VDADRRWSAAEILDAARRRRGALPLAALRLLEALLEDDEVRK
jgi:hypothetical protein